MTADIEELLKDILIFISFRTSAATSRYDICG